MLVGYRCYIASSSKGKCGFMTDLVGGNLVDGNRELQASQPHLNSGKDDGATHSGGHHQVSGGKEGCQE